MDREVPSRPIRLAIRLAAVAVATYLVVGCDVFLTDEARIRRAGQELAKGDYPRAMAYTKSVLQDSPNDPDARLMLGAVSIRIGDEEAALDELDRAQALGAEAARIRDLRYEALIAAEKFAALQSAVEKDTSLPPARKTLLAAIAQAGLGKTVAAASAFDRAHSLAPDDPGVLIAHARFLAGNGEGDAAMQVLGEALERAPRSAAAWSVKGTIEFMRGRYAPARDALAEALELGAGSLTLPEQMAILGRMVEANLGIPDLPAARQSLQQLRSRWPDHPQTHYLAARLALARKDYDRAINELQQTLQRSPGHAETRLLLGAAFLAAGEHGQAEATLASLLDQQPENIEARKLLGQVYLATDRPAAARNLLSHAGVGALEDDARVQWLLGAALIDSGRPVEGVERLEKGLLRDPDNVALRLDLATVYLTTGREGEAAALLQGVPSGAGGARLQALRVLAATRGKAPEEARAAIERLVRESPRDAALVANAGVAMLVGGQDAARARELLARALSLDERQTAARFALAAIEMQQGRMGEADAQLRAVIEREPKNERAYLALAENAESRGDRAQARSFLEQSIGADPAVVESWLQLARLAYLQGQARVGRSLVDQATSVAGGDPQAFVAAGRLLSTIGQYGEAAQLLRKAIDAGSLDARLLAARAYRALAQPDAARDVLATAVSSNPQWLPGLALLTELDARDGRIDAALKALGEARRKGLPGAALDTLEGDVQMIAHHPLEAAALYRRAAALRASSGLAIKEYLAGEAAASQQPEAPLVAWLQRRPGDATVRRVLASHYLKSGQPKPAIREYELLVASPVTADLVSLNNLAWLYLELGNPRALPVARRAHDLAPGNPAVLDTYGWVLLKSGRPPEAVKALEQAQKLVPDNAEVRYHLAEAYAAARRRRPAHPRPSMPSPKSASVPGSGTSSSSSPGV